MITECHAGVQTRVRRKRRPSVPTLAAAFGLSLAACSSSDAVPDASNPVHDAGGAALAADAGPPDAGLDRASLAAQAYVWGYPLVVTQRTFQTLGAFLGVNVLANAPTLAGLGSRTIVSPNQDTLYSVAVVDLRSEAMLLSVPDVTDRYWTYQFLDAWTNSFHYIGTRATRGKGGSFAIKPSGFQGIGELGPLPDGVEEVESPTPQMFLLGRYLVRDAADASNVVALRRTLEPLSSITGAAPPDPPRALGASPGTPQAVGTTGAEFFDELCDALASNPPATDADRAHLQRFDQLGIRPGQHPAAMARLTNPSELAVLEEGVRIGESMIQDAAQGSTETLNGWIARLDAGAYDDDPLLRAVIAKLAWGANVPEESVYPVSHVDVTGQPYTGAKRYVMHFDAANLPPVETGDGFWSLTLYGPDRFFVANDIDRFAIGDRTPGLTFNADGSLDIYIQSDSPQGHEGNWLPAPPPTAAGEGAFTLMLRLYLPAPSVLDGSYEYPGVTPM